MQAKVWIELKDSAGRTLASRHVRNAVMQAGAQLIANLFAGKGTPITHMGVGTSDTPETDAFATTALTNAAVGDAAPLTGLTEAALPPEAFPPPEVDQANRVVRVRVRGTLPPDAAVGTVREAGLISRSGATAILYNRVTFTPIVKGNDHELSLFWEVTFPYGDLQGLI
jgi:hypothetical protein